MTVENTAVKTTSEALMQAISDAQNGVEMYTEDVRLFPPGGDFDGWKSRDAFDGSSGPVKRLSKAYVASYWAHVFSILTGA